MRKISIKDYLIILDKQADELIKEIERESSIDSKTLHPNKADYPILNLANKEYYEYAYYMGKLEWRIRDYLITGVLCNWFDLIGNDCFIPTEKHVVVRYSYSNESFGKDYPFAFILVTNTERIGIRYSSLYYESKDDLLKLLESYNVDKVEIIDWDDTDALISKKSIPTKDKISGYLSYLTLRQFIEKYFLPDLFPCYRDKVRNLVEKANSIIGFQTIPMLSMRHLSEFKDSVLKDLLSFQFENQQYQKFNKNGQLTDELSGTLSTNACNIIRKRCIEDELCAALVGSEKFAKCFITSEYLFQLFKSGEQHYFDYSTVVSGYFKSVELLLEKIMLTTLKRTNHEQLWINSTESNKKLVDDVNYRRNPNNKRIIQVRFSEDKINKFKTEMGPLIYFIHDNDEGWYLQNNDKDRSRKIIHDCLLNYNQGCRNEHLHKDV